MRHPHPMDTESTVTTPELMLHKSNSNTHMHKNLCDKLYYHSNSTHFCTNCMQRYVHCQNALYNLPIHV